jgi:hypothetical protein
VAMKMYEDAKIPIQSWICATISMGTLEENGRLLENGNNDKGGCGWYGVCETVSVNGWSLQDTVSCWRVYRMVIWMKDRHPTQPNNNMISLLS